ncbi:MAG: Proline/betaine transporter, partial [Pseudomonadota bacterium]
MSNKTTPPSLFKIIIIGLIGNMMEWYDFAVYGYFATIIARLFFPMTDPAVSLIASFGAFAAGFLMRPIGGLVFGRIGDLVGRQKAMTLSVIAMAAPTILMAFLPTYETVGVLAPILLIALRMLQG